VINDDDLPLLVLVLQHLGNVLVLLYASAREVQGLTNVVLFVLVSLAEIYQQKVSLNADWELLGFDCDGGEVGDLAAGVLLRLVPGINRL
jgi:hypothetical protein